MSILPDIDNTMSDEELAKIAIFYSRLIQSRILLPEDYRTVAQKISYWQKNLPEAFNRFYEVLKIEGPKGTFARKPS